MWRATILTLFPEMFPGPLGLSLAGKALASGLWSLEAHDVRAQATDRHGTVTAIHNFGAGDLVEIKPVGGGEPLMVPFTDAAVPEIDIAGRRIVVVPLTPTE